MSEASRPRRAALVAVCLGALGPAGAGAPLAAQSPEEAAASARPATRAERTGFAETSRHADVVAFLDSLRILRPGLDLRSFGYSERGRILPLVAFGTEPEKPLAALRDDPRLRVLVLANIHAGEVAGKEAALVLARELAAGRRDGWLDSLVVLVAPIYNADGNEEISLRSRPGQYGPIAGMGGRETALGLDLNRDNTKLDGAETRALARLLVEADPHVLIDLHTTDGTVHAYHLTYAPPLHPSTDPAIVAELRERWLPAATKSVRDRYGWEIFHYGNVPGTFGMRGERGWYTFDHRPRFTTNWVGLRNRFGILSEAYAYASFEERILAHRRFVEALLDYATAHAGRLRELTDRADESVGPGREVALRAEALRGDTITVLLGEARREPNPFTGEPMLVRLDARRPERMPDFTSFRPTETAELPAAYLLAPGQEEATERLRAQGILLRELGAPARLEVERFDVDSARTSEREYQNRRPRVLYGTWRREAVELPAGTIAVPTAQPLGALAGLLLEPRSDDGLAAWAVLREGEDGAYPALRADRLPDGLGP
ncbi:MAG: M14 family metallopeptidase [Gemmatimonadota bacterium]